MHQPSCFSYKCSITQSKIEAKFSNIKAQNCSSFNLSSDRRHEKSKDWPIDFGTWHRLITAAKITLKTLIQCVSKVSRPTAQTRCNQKIIHHRVLFSANNKIQDPRSASMQHRQPCNAPIIYQIRLIRLNLFHRSSTSHRHQHSIH